MTQRRTQVVCGIALPASRIRHYINERLRKFPQIASVSQVVSPDASLRPVAQLGGRVQWLVGVLAVGVRGKPHVGQQVQPPTVKMNFRLARVRDIRAVKPNDVIILVFHPDPAQEAVLSGLPQGRHLDQKAAHISQKLPPQKREAVMLPIEIRRIGKNRSREINAGETASVKRGNLTHDSRRGCDGRSLQVRRFFNLAVSQPELSQKVIIAGRCKTHLAVRFRLLQIGLGDWLEVGKQFQQSMFLLDNAVYR